jgi:hypothetical protein
MARRKVVEVAPRKGSSPGWTVSVRGQSGGEDFRTKDPAVGRGRSIAKAAPLGQLIIKKEDGRIQEERTYGKDPHPPKG